MQPAKTHLAFASALSDQSLLIACAFYNLQAIQRGINENPCHTEWMYRLISVFAGHTGLIVGFVVCWLISRQGINCPSHNMRKCTFGHGHPYSKTCVRQPPLKLTLVVDVERWLSYKGTCHVILLAKLHDMYLYKTDNFFHINHYLKSASKVALLHRFYCTHLDQHSYPKVIKLFFSCSTQLSMKFVLQVNLKLLQILSCWT